MPSSTGETGERLAADYLVKQRGYTIIALNWRCPVGEIDIIARDHDTLVFVEVKTRHAASTEAAFASITPAKREKLTRAAYTYLNGQAAEDALWRIDVVAVALSRHALPIIHYVQDAFDW
ncbi:YraN family protein [bacterium]|nr:YraN family protein [bacterium]